MNNAKIFTLILLPLLAMSTVAYVYAHVTDSVVKKYKLHVQESNVVIGSYKVVSRYDDDLIDKYPPDDELQQMGGTTSLSISTDNALVCQNILNFACGRRVSSAHQNQRVNIFGFVLSYFKVLC